MSGSGDYDISTDVRFPPLTLIDVEAEAAAHTPWFNETLTQVGSSVVRLGVIEGEFHWHKHDEEDEFFFVVSGELLIDVEGAAEPVVLSPHQGFTVPRGVVHRTRAPARTTILMVEPADVVPTGS
ncbi:MAG TPA: cupin domain-containing protein [Solirubrobacteraceae bacterium]|nr:cupin domain-containing protein [Solirubrobacteraceae bacterium]